jgi:hypothetical protein
MSRELELRRHPPVPLQEGWEWWVDYPHRLAARVRADRSVVELGRWELAPGLHGAVVRRLRPRRPEWHGQAVAVAGVSLMVLALLALAKLALDALVLIWPILMVLGVLYGGLRLTTGHRPVCVGLHCPGCRH